LLLTIEKYSLTCSGLPRDKKVARNDGLSALVNSRNIRHPGEGRGPACRVYGIVVFTVDCFCSSIGAKVWLLLSRADGLTGPSCQARGWLGATGTWAWLV